MKKNNFPSDSYSYKYAKICMKLMATEAGVSCHPASSSSFPSRRVDDYSPPWPPCSELWMLLLAAERQSGPPIFLAWQSAGTHAVTAVLPLVIIGRASNSCESSSRTPSPILFSFFSVIAMNHAEVKVHGSPTAMMFGLCAHAMICLVFPTKQQAP